MSSPKISVILPVFNAEKFVADALSSLIDQEFDDFEIVIIDDGSTDGSVSIIKSFIDSRIVLHRNPHNLGLVESLKVGLGIARGEFIARMDADDMAMPQRFSKQLRTIVATNSDICGCHWLVVNELGVPIDAVIAPGDPDGFLLHLCEGSPFAHGSVLFRRSFFDANSLAYGGEPYAEDYKLWIEFYNAGAKFITVSEFLYSYRVVPKSLSRIRRKEGFLTSLRLRREFVSSNYDECLALMTRLVPVIDLLHNRLVFQLLVMILNLSRIRFGNLFFLVRAFFGCSPKQMLIGFYRICRS